MNSLKNCKIEDTLTALQEAIEDKKKRMHHAKQQDTGAGASPVVSGVIAEVFNRAAGAYGQVGHLVGGAQEFAGHFIVQVQEDLKEKPWDVLRKVAMYSFTAGLFLNLHHRKSSARKKT